MSDQEASNSGKRMRPSSMVGLYFDYDNQTKRSKCLVPGCGMSLAGKHTSNLEKHVMRRHPKEANEITAKRVQLQAARSSQTPENGQQAGSGSSFDADDGPSSSRRKPPKLGIEMTKRGLLDACVELVTVNGCSLSLFEKSGMRLLLDPIVNALGAQESHVAINRHNVLEEVHAEARRVRDTIRKEVQGRLVSIKVDTATRLDRAVMGVNAQFSKEGKIVLRNLCIKELYTRHTGENIMKEVTEVLADFGIMPEMVYSMTTDNASNMVRAVQLLGKGVDMPLGEEDGEEEEIEEDVAISAPNEVEEEWAATFAALPNHVKWEGVLGLRCAAHTLQLAVADALKDDGATKVLNAARMMCKKLRTPTIACLLTRLGRAKPSLDCPTRWHSTLDMVESLLRVRDVCGDVIPSGPQGRNSAHTLGDPEWDYLEDLARALLPAKVATKQLQEEQLLVGDFLETWLRCKIDTKSVNTPLAQSLFSAMDLREAQLFKSPAILCGIFMDPRWHVMLSAEQRAVAEEHLIMVWRRLETLRSEPVVGTTDSAPQPQSSASTADVEVEEDPLEQMLMRREATVRAEERVIPHRDVRQLLRDISKVPRLPRKDNVLTYWENRRQSDPELYEIAITVLGVPVTQVSVERLFSHLKIVFTYLRSRLRTSVINDIILVRCNRIFRRKE